MKQMFRGILSEGQIQLLASDVWPKFAKGVAIEYSRLFDEMAACRQLHGLEFEADSVIRWWVEQQFLEVAPDHKRFRFKERAVAQLEAWAEENHLWDGSSSQPMPLNKRLMAGQPARNLRKINEVLDREPAGSENAKHDHQFFDDKWKIGTVVQ